MLMGATSVGTSTVATIPIPGANDFTVNISLGHTIGTRADSTQSWAADGRTDEKKMMKQGGGGRRTDEEKPKNHKHKLHTEWASSKKYVVKVMIQRVF
jgi:hypothetical protein